LNARQEYVVIEATSAQQVKKRKIVKNHLPVYNLSNVTPQQQK